ncbi:MAG: radical SAM family heme chaperone HemW [Armatimonadota bacterium]
MTEERSPLSVYVHLPFCARKCHYCDFNSRPGSAEQRAQYLDALKMEIAGRAEMLGGCDVRTIFFGGGTPTVYEAGELGGLLESVIEPRPPASAVCRTGFQPVGGSVEVTCEANPETVDLPKLRALREAGFNRISIGAQSFHDDELTILGRGHTVEQTEEAVRAAREAGFENVSLDLIYALPGQTLDRWRETLRRALALRPEHLSAYGLELAEGTPLFARWQRGEIAPVGESEHLAMREVTLNVCEQAGLRRYEISNYAVPGRECAHNVTYWRNEDYLGLGAGAWSYLGGIRSANLREATEYVRAIETGDDLTAYKERLDADDGLAEALMMGLRMVEGLNVAALERTWGESRVREMMTRARPLAEMGLLNLRDGRIRLTNDGESLHGEVCLRLT